VHSSNRVPVNRLLPLADQVIIGLGEMFAAQKTAMGRQWGWMWRTQNKMPGRIDNLTFFLRIAAPPATPLMRGSLTRFNGQHAVQKKYALLGPTIQATFALSSQFDFCIDVGVNLLVNILQ